MSSQRDLPRPECTDRHDDRDSTLRSLGHIFSQPLARTTRTLCKHFFGNSARDVTILLPILLAACLVVAPVAVVSAGGLDPLYSIPNPDPGVSKSYDDTYRVLANNDVDLHPDNVSYTGYFQNDFPQYPINLGESTHSPSQVLRYAATGDVYVTSVTPTSSIPYQDYWLPYASVASYADTQFFLVHGNNTYDGPTDSSGKWFVRVTNPYGDHRPVYDAEVGWDEVNERLYVANPDTALVHTAVYGGPGTRAAHAAQRYSEYADDPSRVAVPLFEGAELYPTTDGGTMSQRWGQGPYDTISDSWVGINGIFGAVWYRDSYVSGGTPMRGAYVPYDFRASAPPDYSQSDYCTRIHRHTTTGGNSTVTWNHTHYYPKTEWATYRLVDANATVTSVRLDRPGFSGDAEWRQTTDVSWVAMDDSGRHYAYPRGNYTLTATLEVQATIETEWGVTSSECSEWTNTDTDTYAVTTTYSVPVTITDWDSPNLELDVAHIDGPGHDRLIVQWSGDQDLPGDPWRQIAVAIDNKTVQLNSPWRFYGVSRNDEVDVRTAGGSSMHDATHTHGDRWPAIYRYETSVANVSIGMPQTHNKDQDWGYLERVDSQLATTLPGAPLAAGVDDPENAPPTDIYSRYVLEVRSSDLATGEAVTVQASTPFSPLVQSDQIDVYQRPYAESVLRLVDVNESATSKDYEGVLVLTNTSGNPLAGKPLHVRQRDGTEWTVMTDGAGRADIAWDGLMIRARYGGDIWFSPASPYYCGDSLFHVVPPTLDAFAPIGSVGEYLQASISNALLFAEWVLLGVFAVWWVRMRRRTNNRGSA